MRSGAAGHADKIVIKSIEMIGGAGLLFDVSLVMVRRRDSKVMRMLNT